MLFSNIIQLIVHALPSIWGGVIKISLKIELFIRKVIICEPPFEAVQLNIQYL